MAAAGPGGDKRVYAWLADGLARRGYAAASVTYRFAPAARAPAQMDDVQRAVRWLRKNAQEYGVDPERVGAIGGSAGGHLEPIWLWPRRATTATRNWRRTPAASSAPSIVTGRSTSRR